MHTDSPDQLSLEEARKKLGLGPADHAADYLPQWREVEKKLVGMANREQSEETLATYEKDLAALRQVIDTLEKEPSKKRYPVGLIIWGLFVMALIGGGLWAYEEWGSQFDPAKANADLKSEMAAVEIALEKRRWTEVEELVTKLKAKGASKKWSREITERIAAERIIESGQQMGYFIGGAQAGLEAGRIEEARNFASRAKEIDPENQEIIALFELIDKSEREFKLSKLIDGVEKAVRSKQWVAAEGQLSDLANLDANHSSLPELRLVFQTAQAKWQTDRARSKELLAQSMLLDQGSYSGEALRLLEEALRLDPTDEVRALYQKMSAYGRVLTVPSEFPTISAALKEARTRDRVQISKGTYKEKLHLPPGVVLVGEGRAATIIECPATEGAVLAVDGVGAMARVASMTLRHQGLVNDSERFSVVSVSAGRLRLEDISIDKASGHGVAVVDTGALEMIQCEVSGCGWDGVSIQGESSQAKLTGVISRENLHHGIDFWDGASGSVVDSTLIKNGRAGLVALGPSSGISVTGTQSSHNHELGILISNAPSAIITGCRVTKNGLGGIVLQDQVQHAKLTGNQITDNGEAGLVIEKGSLVDDLKDNVVKKNKGRQIWKDAVFPEAVDEDIVSPPIPAPPEK